MGEEEDINFLKMVNGIVEDGNRLNPVVPQAFHIAIKNLKEIKLVVLMKNPGLDTLFNQEEAQIEEQEKYRKSLIGEFNEGFLYLG